MPAKWRSTYQYKKFREGVIDDEEACCICGETDNLQIHHINHAVYFPEERYVRDNVTVLCEDCHENFHTNFMRSYRVKCTKKDFDNYKQLYKYFTTKASTRNS